MELGEHVGLELTFLIIAGVGRITEEPKLLVGE
jgi:hypothetical protein